jgi:hypothetical protein
MEQINLREIELRAFTAYHQDGLIDIAIGLGIAWFGAAMVYDLFYLAGMMPVAIMFLYLAVKRKITVPRIGAVEFSRQRRETTQLLIFLMVLGFAFSLLVGSIFFMTKSGTLPPFLEAALEVLGNYYRIVLGIIGAAFAAFFAYLTGLTRFYRYAGLILTVFLGAHFLDISLPAVLIFAGLVITASGAFLFARFMQENPVPVEGRPV